MPSRHRSRLNGSDSLTPRLAHRSGSSVETSLHRSPSVLALTSTSAANHSPSVTSELGEKFRGPRHQQLPRLKPTQTETFTAINTACDDALSITGPTRQSRRRSYRSETRQLGEGSRSTQQRERSPTLILNGRNLVRFRIKSNYSTVRCDNENTPEVSVHRHATCSNRCFPSVSF
jgi:hypothetical protein